MTNIKQWCLCSIGPKIVLCGFSLLVILMALSDSNLYTRVDNSQLPSVQVNEKDVIGSSSEKTITDFTTTINKEKVKSTDSRVSESTASENISTHNEDKMILFWHQPSNKHWSDGKVGHQLFDNYHCEYSGCILSDDKSQLEKAKAIFFIITGGPPDFPPVRYPGQLYIHITNEPPKPLDLNLSMTDSFEDVLNLTINYRRDADISHPYALFEPKEVSQQSNEMYFPKVPFKNRTRSVCWLVSNCHAHSHRELYVEELSKHIDVDIYGKCGNLSCPFGTSGNRFENCYGLLGQKYKFYLTLQNTICPDYYSEQLGNAYEAELIPIVLGMVNYSDPSIAPPHSVINVQDFESPKDLANFLKGITEEEFNEYFQWQRFYKRQHLIPSICSICKILHSDKYLRGEQFVPSYKKFGGYRKWWIESCDNDLIYRMREKGGW